MQGDQKAERVLVPGGPHGQTTEDEDFYRVTVRTSDIRFAGTDADVEVEILGWTEESEGERLSARHSTRRQRIPRFPRTPRLVVATWSSHRPCTFGTLSR